MLAVEHRAFHLYREDAYREYCWSVDVYGSYQPASFIYLCFESFKDACAVFGLELVYQSTNRRQDQPPWRFEREAPTRDASPQGVVLRIESDEDADAAMAALHRGQNVLALIPSGVLGILYPSDEARLQRAKEATRKLGVNPDEWDFQQRSNPETAVRWIEMQKDMLGRLLLTHDSFLSEGYFLSRYQGSRENRNEIESLIRCFASFKSSLLRLSYRNAVRIWPTGEPLTVFVDVWNHGPDMTGAVLTLNVGRQLEPVSPVEREIPRLRSLERATFALQVVPRSDGGVSVVSSARASLHTGQDCLVISEPLPLEIVPGIGLPQRSGAPQDDATLGRLVAVFRNARLPSDVESLPELARVDARACLSRLRVLTERIVIKALGARGIGSRERNLAAAISMLASNGEVSQRAVSYLHTIRTLGNIASHASDQPLSDVDVRIVSYALACVVEEFMDRKLL